MIWYPNKVVSHVWMQFASPKHVIPMISMSITKNVWMICKMFMVNAPLTAMQRSRLIPTAFWLVLMTLLTITITVLVRPDVPTDVHVRTTTVKSMIVPTIIQSWSSNMVAEIINWILSSLISMVPWIKTSHSDSKTIPMSMLHVLFSIEKNGMSLAATINQDRFVLISEFLIYNRP